MLYTEFVSSEALIRDVNRTITKALLFTPEERPIAIQIYGHDPESMAEAGTHSRRSKPDIIDINFWLSGKKMAGKRGAERGFCRDIERMLKITTDVVNGKLPVTVKHV